MTCLRMNLTMNQFDVYVANLDPTIGSEIKKTRPVVIISPNELNHNIKTVIVAPVTSQTHNNIPTRVPIKLKENSFAVLDQIRTLDKARLTTYITTLKTSESEAIKSTLLEMFS